MSKELIENKKWLQKCQEAYNDLRKICCDADDNIKVDEQLENHIKGLFPIFNKIPYYNICFGYQSEELFVFGKKKHELYLYISFPEEYYTDVKLWFKNSIYTKFMIKTISDTTLCLVFKPDDLIADISQKQVNNLQKQLAEESILWWMNIHGGK